MTKTLDRVIDEHRAAAEHALLAGEEWDRLNRRATATRDPEHVAEAERAWQRFSAARGAADAAWCRLLEAYRGRVAPRGGTA